VFRPRTGSGGFLPLFEKSARRPRPNRGTRRIEELDSRTGAGEALHLFEGRQSAHRLIGFFFFHELNAADALTRSQNRRLPALQAVTRHPLGNGEQILGGIASIKHPDVVWKHFGRVYWKGDYWGVRVFSAGDAHRLKSPRSRNLGLGRRRRRWLRGRIT